MTLSTKIKLGCLVTLILLIGYKLYSCNKPQVTTSSKGLQTLKPNETAKVSYQSTTHTLTEVKNNGTVTKEYVRNPVITVTKTGAVQIDRNDYGFEAEPYIGLGFHEKMRIELGASLLYYNKFDLGLGLSLTTNSNVPVNEWVRGNFLVSYNIWDNTNLYLGVDTNKTPNFGLFLRF